MRRHLLMLALTVAVVVTLALIRPRWRAPEHVIKPAAPAAQPIEEPATIDSEVTRVPAAPPPPPAPPPKPRGPNRVTQEAYKPGMCVVTVLGFDGEPAAKAVVLLINYSDMWTPTTVDEMQADDGGRVEFERKDRQYIRFLAYKPGEGTGDSGVLRRFSDVTVQLKLGAHMRFVCMENNGAPAEKAEITVVTELRLPNRQGEPVLLALPPRKAVTDRAGKCEIDALFLMPPSARVKGNLVRGCRYIAKAAWQDLTSPEETIEDPPVKDVVLILTVVR